MTNPLFEANGRYQQHMAHPQPQGTQVLPKALSVEGVIAFEGNLLDGTEFVPFDQQAIKLLKAQKRKVRLLEP